MLATLYSLATKAVRRQAKKIVMDLEEITKPEAISEYTANMGGIDNADQHCSSYALTNEMVAKAVFLYFRGGYRQQFSIG